MRNNIIYTLFFFSLFAATTLPASAQFEEGKETVILAPIIGNAITTGAGDTITYTNNGEYARKIKNIISFRIDEDNATTFFKSGFTATVNFTLETRVTPGSSPVLSPKSLVVNYDNTPGAKYNARAYMVLPLEYEVVAIRVTGITINGQSGWDPTPMLKLENEMRILRYYTLSNNPPVLAPLFNPRVVFPDALGISWMWNAAANNNMSQIEWTWLETEMRGYYTQAGVFDLERLFRENSTRVDIELSKNAFKIPLLYDGAGKLFYRVRAVYRTNEGNVFTGQWSVDSFAYAGHEPNLNWQSSITFSENGRFTASVEYFDGILKSRQVVRKDNSTNNTIVEETFYDLQGRTAIQVLPTPTNDTVIKFFNDFNRFQGQGITDNPAKYFDLTPLALQCTTTPRLDSNYGNAKYYSANNPWLGSEPKSKFIPNAFGFAYTETRFMDDATQRVRSQGGLGQSLQAGSGKEAKYYYGKPSQPELDALFGTEVGDASHYMKNMAKDANGQVSVTYIDMHGRTIATALAGYATPGIDSLLADPTDYPLPNTVLTNQLLTPASNIVSGNSVESISTLLLAAPAQCDFTYKLDPAILSLLNCDNQQVCFDCKYDLEISIKSEDCGDTTPIVRRYSNLQIVPANQACSTSMGFVGEGINTATRQIDFSITLGVGSWVIRKTLTVNDSMFKLRRDSALNAFLCKTRQSIYDSVYTVLYNTSGCGTTGTAQSCSTCLTTLGPYNLYRINYLASIGNPPSYNEATIQAQYTQDSLACVQACSLSPQLSTLGGYRSQLLTDMMPFTGQYATETIPNPNNLEGRYNIFTNSFYYGGTTFSKPYYYRNPVNENGSATVYLAEDNQTDPSIHPPGDPNFLNNIGAQDFAGLFQPSWAASLIYYHPEFSKLKFAETTLKTSFDWLDKVLACDSWDAAVQLGANNPMANDPYFTNNYVPQDVTDMQRFLTNYIGTNSGNPSIWRLANGVILCATIPENQRMACINTKSLNGMDPSANTVELRNKIWQQFKTMYLSYRNEMVMKYINTRPGVLSQADMTTLQNEQKQLVFVTMSGIAAQNGWSSWWNNVTNGDTTGTGVYAGNNANNIDNCEAQRPFWRARLLQCEQLMTLLNNETPADSATVNNIINSILTGLVSVCNNSRDSQHPWGASNVRPGYAGQPQTFEQVVNQVFTANGISTLPDKYFCNPFSIDFPKPYGKNPPVVTNISDRLDSCACNRFRSLKLEAKALGFDTLTMSGMNQFLNANYNDSVTAVVWDGLSRCNQIYADSCWYTYDAAYTCTLRQSSRLSPGKDTVMAVRPPPDLCPFEDPVITSVQYVTTGLIKNVRVYYDCLPFGATSCEIEVRDEFWNVVNVQPVTCGSGLSVLMSLPPCQYYYFTLINYTASCGTYYSLVNELAPLPSCGGCPEPVINSVSIAPNPTPFTQNVNINYTIPSGAFNCELKIFSYNCNFLYPVDTLLVNCNANSISVPLSSCLQYRFVLSCDISGINASCDPIAVSDTARLDSCWKQTCMKVYTPVPLSDFAPIPQFLNCGYQKPCITCGKLDSLTTEFRQLYPSFSAVPYLDSAATDDQARQNSLWARFLNYRTGFSKNAIDYMVAYNNCHTQSPPPSLAICSFTKPLNDQTDIYPPDTIPCKNVQTQAQFIAYLYYEKQKDSLIAKFDSLYLAACLNAKNTEEFYVKYKPREYHYTLYYYDQAGNLVKTMPPAAVKPNYNAAFLSNVTTARASGGIYHNTLNDTVLVTQYRYNSINQLVMQKSPDGGTRRYWYDRLGRLVISQNSKQAAIAAYSYMRYDELGRVIEAGEKTGTAMTQAIAQDTTALKNWLAAGGIKQQITRTIYDEAYSSLNVPGGLWQKHLRNRVSYVYVKNADNQADIWNAATFYSYDVHGNVDTVLQDLKTGMGAIMCSNDPLTNSGNRFKKTVYKLDLISGNVNEIAYQPGWPDQFYHSYKYDEENRIKEVKTSRDKIYWETDGRYDYFRHGPLSRLTLGQNKVQGIDYVYTLQGWLKGINSTDFQATANPVNYDAGQDGVNIAGNPNRYVSKDAFGFSIEYFSGDYKAISANTIPFAEVPQFLPADGNGIATGSNLFNGNIRAMAVNIPQLGAARLYGYRYDQLGRYKRMDAFTGTHGAGNTAALTRTNDYHEEVSYDPNGNIRTYLRNGTTQAGNQLAMDNMTYQYERSSGGQLASNRLRYVHDQVSSANYLNEDIDSQTPLNLSQVQADNNISQAGDNYRYDEIGNLIKDQAGGIANIEWSLGGKIKAITKTNGSVISYTYDALGERISKTVSTGGIDTTTYYVRNANGNVMSIYMRIATSSTNIMPLTQTELNILGNSRLGVYTVNVDVQQCATVAPEVTYFRRGDKLFELANHLGNIVVTVSDRQIQVDNDLDGVIDYFIADVRTAVDYYPFGMMMPGRTYNSNGYRYGFGSMEKNSEAKGEGNSYTTFFREYDPRIGRWFSMDPKTDKYPCLSPYVAFHNNPLFYNDPRGDDPPKGWTKHTNTVDGKPIWLPKNVKVELYTAKNTDDKSLIGKIRAFNIGNTRFVGTYGGAYKVPKGPLVRPFYGYGNWNPQPGKGVNFYYKTPDITLNSSSMGAGTSTGDFTVKAQYTVTGVPSGSGVKFIQTFVGNAISVPTQVAIGITPARTLRPIGTHVNGNSEFVDGRNTWKAPSVTHSGLPPNSSSPFYVNVDDASTDVAQAGDVVNGTAVVKYYDRPLAVRNHTRAKFEVVIVLTNFMNSGKDMPVGTFTFSYNANGTTSSGGATNNLQVQSTQSRAVLRRDYPGYKFFDE